MLRLCRSHCVGWDEHLSCDHGTQTENSRCFATLVESGFAFSQQRGRIHGLLSYSLCPLSVIQ